MTEELDNYKWEVRNLLKKLRDVSEAAMKAGWRAESGVSIPEYIEELGKGKVDKVKRVIEIGILGVFILVMFAILYLLMTLPGEVPDTVMFMG